MSGEKEKLLYIIAGERPGERADASGQWLVNDAYSESPCEDSLGYSNDYIYIQPHKQTWNWDECCIDTAFTPHSHLTWLNQKPHTSSNNYMFISSETECWLIVQLYMPKVKMLMNLMKRGGIYHLTKLLREVTAAHWEGQSDVDLCDISAINSSLLTWKPLVLA